MSHSIFLWILALSFTGASEASAYPEQNWDELVTRLRAIDSVSGRTAGFYAEPGEFLNLSQTMIDVGKEEDFRRLLSDEQAIVRCMGLLGLAQINGKAAAPTIRAYVYDSGKINYCLGGYRIPIATVGCFAWNLLLDANHLKHADVPAPLLSRSESIALEIESLAVDSFMGGRFNTPVVEHPTLPLQLSTLKAHAPVLEDYRIIKGIGRLVPSVRQRDFLIACLQDRTLDANARLAAGSALTCHTDDVALRAIQKECSLLNSLDEQRWGDRFIETVNARQVHETNMEPVIVEWASEDEHVRHIPTLGSADELFRAKRTWQTFEEIKGRVIVAFTCHHPLALVDLWGTPTLSFARRDTDVRRAVANSLIEISRNLRDHNQPWSTYADSASILALRVQVERQTGLQQMRTLTDAECAEIEKNIAESQGDQQSPVEEEPSGPANVAGGEPVR